MFGIPAIVAINSFPTDTPAEVEAIREVALAAGARDAVVATHFVDGGAGAAALAEAVWAATEDGAADFELLYPDEHAARRRRSRRSRRGSTAATASSSCRRPRKSLAQFEALGYGHLPICMAKTQYSLSHDAALKGRPTGFTVPIREVRLSAGAGFITPLCGEMRTMPGPAVEARAARRSTSTPTGTSSACSERRRLRARDRSDRGGRRDHEAERDDEADHDAQDRRRPRPRRSIGPSASSAWAWSSCSVIVAVVVERVMRDRDPTWPGASSACGSSLIVSVEPPRSFWQTIAGVVAARRLPACVDRPGPSIRA